jgi:hypothetical protein
MLRKYYFSGCSSNILVMFKKGMTLGISNEMFREEEIDFLEFPSIKIRE